MCAMFRGCLVACLVVLAGGVAPRAQYEKNISVTFDGWNKMPDGSYELVFGYLNRNPQDVQVPIGPDNAVQPGGPDLGQPTTFLPGRQRIMFRIPVAKDFKGKFVWTCELRRRCAATRPRRSTRTTRLTRGSSRRRASRRRRPSRCPSPSLRRWHRPSAPHRPVPPPNSKAGHAIGRRRRA